MDSIAITIRLFLIIIAHYSYRGVYGVREVEYERSGFCLVTEECVYKYTAEQYSFGEKDREELKLSADVNWHCESTGTFGTKPAEELCFTLTDAAVSGSVGLDANFKVNYTTDAERDAAIATFLANELEGEFCYVQTSDGKIVSVHYAPTVGHDGLNIKRSIASAFQARFDDEEDVEEFDAGSIHTSHYTFAKKSDGVTEFTRKIKTGDLIETPGEVPENSMSYDKEEDSSFDNKILSRSQGRMRTKVDFGHNQEEDSEVNVDGMNDGNTASNTFDPNINFGKEFEANGTYVLQKAYCKTRTSRSVTFTDLSGPGTVKGNLMATIDMANSAKIKMRKIRGSISSIPKLLEEFRRNASNTRKVDMFWQLLHLEVQHGTANGESPAIEQLIQYFNKIRMSNRPENVRIRKLIYFFLTADSSEQTQEIFGSQLGRRLSNDEKEVLLHQLTQIRNASSKLVNTIINMSPTSDDDILLVLGALARNNNEGIQNTVVNELLRKLDSIKSTSNTTDTMIGLNYALGNTGSRLTIGTLISSLHYDDDDMKVSAIRGLAVHLDQVEVQKSFAEVLSTTSEDHLLDEVVNGLIDAFDGQTLTSPNGELLRVTVEAAIRIKNPNLYELLLKYLTRIGTDEAKSYAILITQQPNYGDVQNEVVSDSLDDTRIKRGSDWDASNRYYDVVASYSQRRSDVQTYPHHKAYIWGKSFGVSKLKMSMGVGVFGGLGSNGLKLYAKAAAKVQVFSRAFDVAQLEYSDTVTKLKEPDIASASDGIGMQSTTEIRRKVYVKLGPYVIKNVNQVFTPDDCLTTSAPLWQTREHTLFSARFVYFVYIGTIDFAIKGTASSNAKARSCVCPLGLRACTDIVPTVTLRVTGSASASLLYLVQGGIDVAATFTYFVQPKFCLQQQEYQTCASLYHGWPTSTVEIEPWYQTSYYSLWSGHVWNSRQTWGATSWDLPSKRAHLWSSCAAPISPCSY